MIAQIRRHKFILLFLVVITLTVCVTVLKYPLNQFTDPKNWRGLSNKEISQLAEMGRFLYLDVYERPEKKDPKKFYEILFWKTGEFIENRHLKNFGPNRIDPLDGCSVHNCRITFNNDSLNTADLVIFHLQKIRPRDIPVRPRSDQIWAFLTDESPLHTPIYSDFNGVFNWSMTYRMNSEIPVPYGRTVPRRQPLEEPPEPPNKRQDVLVTILGSNCGGKNHRWQYVKELQKHIEVDIYGACGPLKTCPGGFRKNCDDIAPYMFYLAFENSNCDEYITEKAFWNAYSKNSIPIIMGTSWDVSRKLLPPNSYIHTDDFGSPLDLANYIMRLNTTGQYRDFYEWKMHYEVLNEHGYFQSKSYHFCRACEALNFNDRQSKVYHNLGAYWNKKSDCQGDWTSH